MNVKIADSWKNVLEKEFEKPYFKDLTDFVKAEYTKYTCYPKGADIFNAFDWCSFNDLKVVIIGQDPYHGPNQANGLCFSVKDGGQSAPRFARLREGATKAHYKKVADYMTQELLPLKELKGIILGGPSITINDFERTGFITGDLQKKIIGIKDLSYTDEFGLQELLDKSQDLLAAEEVAEEKKLMADFFTFLATNEKMVTYGEKEVEDAINMGAVDKVLISESLPDDVIEHYEELAQTQGSEVKYITVHTREGEQLKDLGRVAAFLRFPIDY